MRDGNVYAAARPPALAAQLGDVADDWRQIEILGRIDPCHPGRLRLCGVFRRDDAADHHRHVVEPVTRKDIALNYLARSKGVASAPAVENQFDAWLKVAKTSIWRTAHDVKNSHPKASVLKGGRVVFNIKGNDYRLVCQINYLAGVVEIRFFGSHAGMTASMRI
jgi:mRNA interferase HigB